MSSEECTKRFLSNLINTPIERILSGMLCEDDFDKLGPAMDKLSSDSLIIDSYLRPNIKDIVGQIKNTKAKRNVDIFILDNLQDIKVANTENTSVRDRCSEIGYIVRELKSLAIELDIIIIATSSLTRSAYSIDRDTPPRISELRDSGDIENIADIVLLLSHKEEDWQNLFLLAVGKNRNGTNGSLTLTTSYGESRFIEYTPPPEK